MFTENLSSGIFSKGTIVNRIIFFTKTLKNKKIG